VAVVVLVVVVVVVVVVVDVLPDDVLSFCRFLVVGFF
jgi:hypothetical protein